MNESFAKANYFLNNDKVLAVSLGEHVAVFKVDGFDVYLNHKGWSCTNKNCSMWQNQGKTSCCHVKAARMYKDKLLGLGRKSL